MKKRIKIVVISLLMLIPFIKITRIQALTVSRNNITIDNSKSDIIELYANAADNIIGVDFSLVFSTYDIEADFVVNRKYNDKIDGIKHSITFNEALTGKIFLGTININVKDNPKELNGIINIHNATAKINDDEVVNLDNQIINVKVNMIKRIEVDEDSQLLLKIDSKLTNIELKKNVYQYDVTVDSGVMELDLKPIAKDKNTKIDITSQKISEHSDNKIIITATNDGRLEEYTINVKIGKKEARTKVVIDDEKFVGDNSYKIKWLIVLFGLVIALAVSLLLYLKKK